jgi:hypothetical protein
VQIKLHGASFVALLLITLACEGAPPTSTVTQATFEAPTEQLEPTSASSVTAPVDSLAMFMRDIPANIPAYDRDDWRHWTDSDGDCLNTRHEVLVEESRTVVVLTSSGCSVATGSWFAPFTGTLVTDARSLDVDHMVPLANAHRSGGWAWDAEAKQAYANDRSDPGHLIAVTASANRSKGSRGPEEWLPPDQSYWCEYATDWARIKAAWNLTVTAAEFAALKEMLAMCSDGGLELVASDAPVTILVPQPTPTASDASVGSLLYHPNGPNRDCGDFVVWADAQAFYVAAGGSTSDPHRLDGNHDGTACESLPGAP